MTQQSAFEAQFVSKCGRSDCPYCQGANGFNNQAWPGRMCQYGAEDMAVAGSGYHDILKHYYGAVKLSDEQEVPVSTYPVAQPTKWNIPAWTEDIFVPAVVAAGEEYWHLVEADMDANTSSTTLWFDVQDRDKTGALPDGAKLMMKNFGVDPVVLPIKAPPDLIDCPQGRHDVRAWWIEDAKGRKSDRVNNIVSEPKNVPPGFNTGHLGKKYLIKLCVAGAVNPNPTPDPTPTGDLFTAQDKADLKTIQETLTVAQTTLTNLLARH